MIAPMTCKVGQTLTFSGYADDYGSHIVAVEFSLDGGKTWARCDTRSSNPDLAIQWTFSYAPKKAGHYQLRVRSVAGDGRVSPISAVAEFFARDDWLECAS